MSSQVQSDVQLDDRVGLEAQPPRLSSFSTASAPSPTTDMFDPLSPAFSFSAAQHVPTLLSPSAQRSDGSADAASSSPPSPPSESQALSMSTDWSDLAFPTEAVLLATTPPSTSALSAVAASSRPALPTSLPKSMPALHAVHARAMSAAAASSSSSSRSPPSAQLLSPSSSSSRPPSMRLSAGTPSTALSRPLSPSVPPVLTPATGPVASPPSSPGLSGGQRMSPQAPLTARRSSASAVIISAPMPVSAFAVTAPSATALPSFPGTMSGSPAVHSPTAAQSSPSPAPAVSFAVHLLHKPGVIMAAIRSTLATVEHLRHYYKHFAQQQQSSAKALHEQTAAEYGRLQSAQGSGVLSALLAFYDRMNALSQAHSQLGVEVSERCCVPLARCSENGKNMVDVSEKDCKRINAAMDSAHSAVQKEREAAKHALHAFTKERDRDRSDSADASAVSGSGAGGSTQKSALKSALSQLHRRVATSGSTSGGEAAARQAAVDAARRKALRCCETYQKAVDAHNALLQRTWKTTLPSLLRELQAQQEMNLTTITNALHTFADLTDAFHTRTASLNADTLHTLAAVHVDADIRQFVAQTVDEFGLPVFPDPVKYDLSTSVAALRREEDSAMLGPSGALLATPVVSTSLFKNTLDGCLRHDRQSTPLPTAPFAAVCNGGALDVPMIVPYLIASIVQQDGLSSEGLFRLSASSDAVAHTRARLEAHDYCVLETLDSPHTSAALLKAFLRDLQEPLIPTALYDRCIELGKAVMMADKADDRRAELAELSDVLASVPLLHRRVLFHLLSFLAVVAAPAHSAVNRMTRANLSIVFAPSLLRPASMDPVLMLACTQFATQFVLLLMDAFEQGGRDGDWKDEWEWSGREEAGCGAYAWIDRPPHSDEAKGVEEDDSDDGDEECAVLDAEAPAVEQEEEEEEEEEEEALVVTDASAPPAAAAVVAAAASAGGAGALPSGWQRLVDANSGLPYYFHHDTKAVTWVKPSA